jgi:hypothetical protein
MRKFFVTLFMAVAMLAAPAVALAEDFDSFYGWGVVRAVGINDRHLLLQNNEGYEMVIVEEDAAIRDGRGSPLVLEDLHAGSEVEFAGRHWEGATFAFSLRVNFGSMVVGAR